MADSKISDLAAVSSLLGTDEFVLARSGDTKKIATVDLAASLGFTGFSPLDVPLLVGWWDASDAATITDAGGGAVSQWDDKSGNGYHVTAAGGARPTTGTRTINSLNVLDFDGSANVLNKATGFGQSAYALYAVIEPDTVSGTDMIIHSGTAGSADWSFFLNAGVTSYFGGGTVTGPTLSTGVAVLVRAKTGSVGGWTIVRAGGTEGTAGLAVNPVFTNIEIGANNAGANFFEGKIGEIVCVGGPVGGNDDLGIRTYLGDKWGVTA